VAVPTALVTGANRGLGLEVARQLRQRGYAVLAGARDPPALLGADLAIVREALETNTLGPTATPPTQSRRLR
jgi:NAD(P)-dependent dehydrogenase (short-subunit alcohol dehydrogenase family)